MLATAMAPIVADDAPDQLHEAAVGCISLSASKNAGSSELDDRAPRALQRCSGMAWDSNPLSLELVAYRIGKAAEFDSYSFGADVSHGGAASSR
jgi:hypothetical protein